MFWITSQRPIHWREINALTTTVRYQRQKLGMSPPDHDCDRFVNWKLFTPLWCYETSLPITFGVPLSDFLEDTKLFSSFDVLSIWRLCSSAGLTSLHSNSHRSPTPHCGKSPALRLKTLLNTRFSSCLQTTPYFNLSLSCSSHPLGVWWILTP